METAVRQLTINKGYLLDMAAKKWADILSIAKRQGNKFLILHFDDDTYLQDEDNQLTLGHAEFTTFVTIHQNQTKGTQKVNVTLTEVTINHKAEQWTITDKETLHNLAFLIKFYIINHYWQEITTIKLF